MMWLVLAACGPAPIADTDEPAGPITMVGAWTQLSYPPNEHYGYELTVADDGSAHLDDGCWGGGIDDMGLVNRMFNVTFDWNLREDGTTIPARLDGTVDGDTITATLQAQDYPTEDLTLVLGDPVELWECP